MCCAGELGSCGERGIGGEGSERGLVLVLAVGMVAVLSGGGREWEREDTEVVMAWAEV